MSALLPNEICDQILDYLQDDKSTLKSCALTASSWLPRARSRLYRSIHLDWTNCDLFTRLVQSSPGVAKYITKLEFEGVMGFFSGDRSRASTITTWLHNIPADVSLSLISLTHIEAALLTLDTAFVDLFLGRFTRITTLRLYGCTIAKSDSLTRLILSFPHLKILAIMHVLWAREAEQGPVTPMYPPAILPAMEVIRIDNHYVILKVLRWLVSQELHRSVHTLCCSGVSWSELGSFINIFQWFAENLRYFTFSFGDYTIGDTGGLFLHFFSP